MDEHELHRLESSEDIAGPPAVAPDVSSILPRWVAWLIPRYVRALDMHFDGLVRRVEFQREKQRTMQSFIRGLVRVRDERGEALSKATQVQWSLEEKVRHLEASLAASQLLHTSADAHRQQAQDELDQVRARVADLERKLAEITQPEVVVGEIDEETARRFEEAVKAWQAQGSPMKLEPLSVVTPDGLAEATASLRQAVMTPPAAPLFRMMVHPFGMVDITDHLSAQEREHLVGDSRAKRVTVRGVTTIDIGQLLSGRRRKEIAHAVRGARFSVDRDVVLGR